VCNALRCAQIHGFFSRMVAGVDHNTLARCQSARTRLACLIIPADWARFHPAIPHPLPASENAAMTTSLLAAW
jgi:hypothetical protein